MMETTHLDVTTMVVIAAVMMSTQPIAASANAWKSVETLHGKETISAMTKITMLDATMMVEIVVDLMSIPPTALYVNASNQLDSNNYSIHSTYSNFCWKIKI